MSCIVVMNTTPATLRCTLCKGEAPLPLPLQVDQVTELIRQFQRDHFICRAIHTEKPPTWEDVRKTLP